LIHFSVEQDGSNDLVNSKQLMKPLKYFTVVSFVNVVNFWPVWKFYYQRFLFQPPDEIPLFTPIFPELTPSLTYYKKTIKY